MDEGSAGSSIQEAVHGARVLQAEADRAVHLHGEREGRQEGAGGQVLPTPENCGRPPEGAGGGNGEDRGGHEGVGGAVSGVKVSEEQRGLFEGRTEEFQGRISAGRCHEERVQCLISGNSP